MGKILDFSKLGRTFAKGLICEGKCISCDITLPLNFWWNPCIGYVGCTPPSFSCYLSDLLQDNVLLHRQSLNWVPFFQKDQSSEPEFNLYCKMLNAMKMPTYQSFGIFHSFLLLRTKEFVGPAQRGPIKPAPSILHQASL